MDIVRRRSHHSYPYLNCTIAVVTHIPGLLVVVSSDIVPVTSNRCPKGCEARASHTHSLLYIFVDGRSRGIVRTDPIAKPGVSSTLPSAKREML